MNMLAPYAMSCISSLQKFQTDENFKTKLKKQTKHAQADTIRSSPFLFLKKLLVSLLQWSFVALVERVGARGGTIPDS
jgi:hypothetical protein